MLTIKRVPTMVSLNQEDNSKCGKDCLGSCCVSGASLPMYYFLRRYFSNPEKFAYHFNSWNVPDIHTDGLDFDAVDTSDRSELDVLITSQWNDRSDRGLFRYDVTHCETKILPGALGFIAQLNEGRHSKKRPTEFRVDQVLQDFDSKKFNFTKVGQEEMLFCFEESDEPRSVFHTSVSITQSPNVVVINVSPIEYGHVLLVPRVLDCIPQRICESTLLLAIQMAMEVDNPFFRLGYNSLGAFATINHLHFQAYYLKQSFPIEKAPTVCVLKKSRRNGVRISTLRHYPVKTMVYEVGSSVDELAAMVAAACKNLQNENIPYNLLISDRGTRVFLIPQCYAEKQAKGEVPSELLDMQVNPAVWEISGHMVLKRKIDYEAATEEAAWDLLAQVSMSHSRFEEIKRMCIREAETLMEKRSILTNFGLNLPLVRPARDEDGLVTELDLALVKVAQAGGKRTVAGVGTIAGREILAKSQSRVYRDVNQLVPQL